MGRFAVAMLGLVAVGCGASPEARSPQRPAPDPRERPGAPLRFDFVALTGEGADGRPYPRGDRLVVPTGIAGRVVDTRTGEPMRGVAVVATRRDRRQPTEVTQTAADGSYAFPTLPPGTYAVSFYFGELHADVPGVEVAAGAGRQVDASLDASGDDGLLRVDLDEPAWRLVPLRGDPRDSIVVLVRDGDGAPRAGAWVLAAGDGATAEARTDARGQARLGWLPPGRYDLTVAEGAASRTLRDVRVVVGRRTIAGVRLD